MFLRSQPQPIRFLLDDYISCLCADHGTGRQTQNVSCLPNVSTNRNTEPNRSGQKRSIEGIVLAVLEIKSSKNKLADRKSVANRTPYMRSSVTIDMNRYLISI